MIPHDSCSHWESFGEEELSIIYLFSYYFLQLFLSDSKTQEPISGEEMPRSEEYIYKKSGHMVSLRRLVPGILDSCIFCINLVWQLSKVYKEWGISSANLFLFLILLAEECLDSPIMKRLRKEGNRAVFSIYFCNLGNSLKEGWKEENSLERKIMVGILFAFLF